MSFTTALSSPGFSWSFSALRNYENCPRRYHAYNVAKDVQEPEGEAIRQGKAIHAAFDARVAKGTPLPLGMGMHEGMLAKLAAAPGTVHTEQKLALSAELTPATFFSQNAWFRTVLDYTNINGAQAVVVDYKTGRPSEDLTQLQLAAATLFAHSAKVERVKAAMIFTAYDTMERATFKREDTHEIWGEILPRVKKLVDARQRQDYPPKPGHFCKRWCAVKSCGFHGR